MNLIRASPRFMMVYHSLPFVSLYLRPYLFFSVFCLFVCLFHFVFQIHCLFLTFSSALFLFWPLLYLRLVNDIAYSFGDIQGSSNFFTFSGFQTKSKMPSYISALQTINNFRINMSYTILLRYVPY